jgi:hypothetical protein
MATPVLRLRPGDQLASTVCSGTGALACDGLPMSLKAAKPLPASD